MSSKNIFWNIEHVVSFWSSSFQSYFDPYLKQVSLCIDGLSEKSAEYESFLNVEPDKGLIQENLKVLL